MKEMVSRDVDEFREHMFDTSIEGVKSRLEEMISLVQRTLTDDVDKIFTSIARDYRVIVEESQNAEESNLNAEITALLSRYSQKLCIVGLNPEESRSGLHKTGQNQG